VKKELIVSLLVSLLFKRWLKGKPLWTKSTGSTTICVLSIDVRKGSGAGLVDRNAEINESQLPLTCFFQTSVLPTSSGETEGFYLLKILKI